MSWVLIHPHLSEVRAVGTGGWPGLQEWELMRQSLEVRQRRGQELWLHYNQHGGISTLSLSFPGCKLGCHDDNKKPLGTCPASRWPSGNPDVDS